KQRAFEVAPGQAGQEHREQKSKEDVDRRRNLRDASVTTNRLQQGPRHSIVIEIKAVADHPEIANGPKFERGDERRILVEKHGADEEGGEQDRPLLEAVQDLDSGGLCDPAD